MERLHRRHEWRIEQIFEEYAHIVASELEAQGLALSWGGLQRPIGAFRLVIVVMPRCPQQTAKRLTPKRLSRSKALSADVFCFNYWMIYDNV